MALDRPLGRKMAEGASADVIDFVIGFECWKSTQLCLGCTDAANAVEAVGNAPKHPSEPF
jgi:hypothetical protein